MNMNKLPTKKSANKPKLKRKNTPPIKKTVDRARKLVESMLTALEDGLSGDETPEEWKRLFGTKDSAVVSLQKLEQVIGVLSNQVHAMVAPKEVLPEHNLSPEEMALLTEWLAGSGKD